MTYEEAKALLEVYIEVFGDNVLVDKAIDKGIEALDKQIPKKHIIEISHNGLKELHCYSCGATHGVYGDVRIPTTSKYCPYCSQAIDWSDEK